MKHVSVVLLAFAGLSGCVVKSVSQYTARVPNPSVPFASGAASHSQVDISAGATKLGSLVEPELADTSQGVELPKVQSRGEVRINVRPNLYLALVGEAAGGRERLSNRLAEVKDGPVYGAGAMLGGSVALGPQRAVATGLSGWRLGWLTEVMNWNVPYVEYTVTTVDTPFDDTPWQTSIINRGQQNVLTLGLGLSPSYQHGPLTLFGGVFVRNHPTIDAIDVETGLVGDGDEEVRSGPFNALLNAGAEYMFTPRLAGTLQVHQNVTADPVAYGPGVQLALTAKLGDLK